MGTPSDFGGTNIRIGQSPTLATSRVWESRTPFVATDHLRIRKAERRDPGSLAEATERELERLIKRELLAASMVGRSRRKRRSRIETLHNVGRYQTSWLKFRRQRDKGGGQYSSTNGFGFRLTFPEPVTGPIALGYASHYGLGLFEAKE